MKVSWWILNSNSEIWVWCCYSCCYKACRENKIVLWEPAQQLQTGITVLLLLQLTLKQRHVLVISSKKYSKTNVTHLSSGSIRCHADLNMGPILCFSLYLSDLFLLGFSSLLIRVQHDSISQIYHPPPPFNEFPSCSRCTLSPVSHFTFPRPVHKLEHPPLLEWCCVDRSEPLFCCCNHRKEKKKCNGLEWLIPTLIS